MSMWKKLVLVLAVFVGLLVIIWGVFVALASGARADADAVWNQIGDREQIIARYGRVEAENEVAAKLEELTLKFGLSVKPNVDGSAKNDLQGIRHEMTRWLDAQFVRTEKSLDPLPPELEAFFESHGGELDEVAALLETGSPEWKRESGRLSMSDPIPNLLGHMSLFRLNAVASLRAEANGDHEKAWTYQRASWSLMEGLARRPELISKLILVAGSKISAVVIRRLEPPVPDWLDDYVGLDLRAQIIDGMYFDHLVTSTAFESEDATLSDFGGPEVFEGAIITVVRPYFEWALSHGARVWGGAVQKAIGSDPCLPEQLIDQAALDSIPRLAKPVGLITIPNLLSAFTRASYAELYVEDAEMLLELKALRRVDGGWPESLESDQSALCRGGKWVYSSDGETMTLDYDGPIPAPANDPGVVVPLKWTE